MAEKILSSVFAALLAPFYLVLNVGLKKALKTAKQLPNRLDFIEQTPASNQRSIPFPTRVPRDLEIDFLNFRSETYLPPMTWGVAREFAAMCLGNNLPRTITIDVLCDLFLKTSGAQMTRWNEEEQVFEVRFDVIRPTLWVGYAKDITLFQFNQETETYAIFDRHGQRYQPGDKLWEAAMYHTVYLYSIGVPMGSHNWVHFSFPDVCASICFTRLNRSSTLYKLLYPHSRFTIRINNQALFIRRSTENSPTLKDTLTPWKCFPMFGPDFFDGIIENTANHYETAENHLNIGQTMDERIPYFRFLKDYYRVVNQFVQRMAPHLSENDLNTFEEELIKHLPMIEPGHVLEYITIFIWQVSVLHSTEHASYHKYAKIYGFSAITKPIEEGFSYDDISSFNRFKFRCFLDTFVRFNPNPLLDQRLTNYRNYNFEEGSELETIAKTFRDELRDLEKQLANEKATIVETDEMVQSVCF